MRIPKILSTLLLPIMAACAYTPVMAGVTYYEANKTAVINGQTNTAQMISIYNLFKKEEVDTIYIRGPGGSLINGLRIGRMIREEGSTVVVGRKYRCISACAIAAMASKDTRVYGELWLHRPYIPAYPTHMRLDEVNGLALSFSADISYYFVEMGYPILLWKRIASSTNPCYFLAVTSTEGMNTLRGDPLDNKRILVYHRNMCGGTPFGGN